jgi:hypothetical protein
VGNYLTGMTTYERFSEEARVDRNKRNKLQRKSHKKAKDIVYKRICFCFKRPRIGFQSFETDKHSTNDTNTKRLLPAFDDEILEEEKLVREDNISTQNPRNTTTHKMSDSSEISVRGNYWP